MCEFTYVYIYIYIHIRIHIDIYIFIDLYIYLVGMHIHRNMFMCSNLVSFVLPACTVHNSELTYPAQICSGDVHLRGKHLRWGWGWSRRMGSKPAARLSKLQSEFAAVAGAGGRRVCRD